MAGDGNAAGPPGGGPVAAPAATLRSWDLAEARLFPLVMARPHDYERSLTLVRGIAGWLRETCLDLPALLAACERGAALADDAGVRLDRGDLIGLPVELIAAAACAMRYREMSAADAARGRREALERASAAGEDWAVVEEAGDPARAPYLPYQRTEVHVPSGRALIISIEPDETLSGAVWRIDEATMDAGTGGLTIGAELGGYGQQPEFERALAAARARASQSG